MMKPMKLRKEALERGAMDSSGPESRILPLLWIEEWEESQNSLAQSMQCQAASSLDAQSRWSLFQLLIPLVN